MLKIFVDFDHTIFNTEAFKLALYRALQNKISRKLFDRCYTRTMRTYEEGWNYSFQGHARCIAIHSDLKTSWIIEQFEKINRKAGMFMYADAFQFLEYLKKLPAEIILLTFGSVPFQKKKIAFTNTLNYFDKKIFTAHHKDVTALGIKKGDKVIFINDNVDEFRALKKKYPEATFILLDSRLGQYKGQNISFPIFPDLISVRAYLRLKLQEIE